MTSKKPSTKPGHIKPFFPFTELPPEYVIVVASFADTLDVADGATLIDANSEDPNDYFLLKGEVAIEDVYGTETTLKSGTDEALQPLPQLRPSAYTVRARGPVSVIRIPQEVIRRTRAEAPEKDPVLEDESTLDITQSREFFNDFKEELQMNRVRLPSLAPSAARIHGLMNGTKISAADLIAGVAGDPAICAKLLKMANSSLFNAEGRVEELGSLVARLGVYSTREMAACFAFRDVYKQSSPELITRLDRHVAQSQSVSAMSAAVAEIGGAVDPRVAALAGLLHNVGVLPIFSYSMHNAAYALNPDLVDRAIAKMSGKAGVLLAKKWRFSDGIIRSIEQADDWTYRNEDRDDLVNIVLTARYHHAITSVGFKHLPKPRDVPAIAAATGGTFDETLSLKIMSRAKDLLNGKAVA